MNYRGEAFEALSKTQWRDMKKEKKGIVPRWNNSVEVKSHVNKIYIFWKQSLEDVEFLIETSRNFLVTS